MTNSQKVQQRTHLLHRAAFNELHVNRSCPHLHMIRYRSYHTKLSGSNHTAHFCLEPLSRQRLIQVRVAILLVEALLHDCSALQKVAYPYSCFCTLSNLRSRWRCQKMWVLVAGIAMQGGETARTRTNSVGTLASIITGSIKLFIYITVDNFAVVIARQCSKLSVSVGSCPNQFSTSA